ncbi:EamA family transporter RarD [Dysosmobacter sp.]|uniref:EamA family transporter RarD n=1 Tax=Dysosmobacter sp. TaxID=2591382 RepID=UPI003FD7ACDA
MTRNRGPLCVLGCYVIWGVLPIFWHMLAAVDALYVLSARIVASVAFLLVLLAARRRLGTVAEACRDRGALVRMMLSGVFICINWGVYIWAVNGGHALDASLAYYMNPILAVVLGTAVFGERLSPLQWLSVAVTFAGIVVTVVGHGQFPWMALVIGGSFAVYGAVKKGVRAEAEVSVLVETLTLAPFALAYLLWAEARGTGAVGVLSGWQWLLLPLSGIATTVPLLFFARGIKTTPMSLSGILMYVNPTLQFLVSVAVFREKFTAAYGVLFGFVWSGLALYLAAGFLRRRRERKEKAGCE